MLDLDPDEEEINFAHDDVLQMVFGLVVFEFNVQAVLDADFHFDRAVHLRIAAQRVNSNVNLANDIADATDDCNAKEISEKLNF